MAQTAPSLPMRSDEAAGLGIALLGHLALIAVLVLFKPADTAPPAPERMSVTLSDDTALVSTAPNPAADPAADAGPVLGESPPEPAPEPEPVPVPQPVQKVTPPQPKPSVTPPRPQPAARPTAKPTPPRPQPSARPATKPPTTQQRNTRTTPNPRQTGRPGSRNLESDLDSTLGTNGRRTGKDRNSSAQATGQQRAAWQNSVSAKVQGPWQKCPVSGLDLENLRVVVPFTLGRDGHILGFGEPRVSGVTPANRAQVEPFKACAIKAIRRGAPYTGLPAEYYEQWKPRELTFSKGRAQ